MNSQVLIISQRCAARHKQDHVDLSRMLPSRLLHLVRTVQADLRLSGLTQSFLLSGSCLNPPKLLLLRHGQCFARRENYRHSHFLLLQSLFSFNILGSLQFLHAHLLSQVLHSVTHNASNFMSDFFTFFGLPFSLSLLMSLFRLFLRSLSSCPGAPSFLSFSHTSLFSSPSVFPPRLPSSPPSFSALLIFPPFTFSSL